jgi:hypothetical protein
MGFVSLYPSKRTRLTVFSKHRPDAEPDIQSFYHSDTFQKVKLLLFYLIR